MEEGVDTMLYRKGDYHRYLAEFASGDKRRATAEEAHEAYKVCRCVLDYIVVCY